MDGKQWYRDWFNSSFYHKLYFDRDEEEAVPFIRNLIDYLKPPVVARMLDVACGKGRHARILASYGYHVTGLDISPASIGEALKEKTDNLEFYVHDMRLPFHGNYFDYAFNFFTSFGYFRTRREHDDAIRSISRSLKPGGVLVVDYLNVHYAEENLEAREEKKIDGTTYSIQRWHDDSHFYKKITVQDDHLKEPLTFTEKVAKFTMGDFNDMLSYQGMQVQNVFGDYHLGPYHTQTAPRLIVIAVKQKTKPSDNEKRLYSDGRATDALT